MDQIAQEAADALARAVEVLDSGDLLIVPGDLRYFVVADALDDIACERLFAATHRGADRPLTVLIAGPSDVHHVAYGGATLHDAAGSRWPGPTVISMKPRPWLPDALLAGGGEVRVTVPKQAFTNALARQFGPLAAASARIQGQSDSLDATTASDRLASGVRLCIDGGSLPGGAEETVLSQQG